MMLCHRLEIVAMTLLWLVSVPVAAGQIRAGKSASKARARASKDVRGALTVGSALVKQWIVVHWVENCLFVGLLCPCLSLFAWGSSWLKTTCWYLRLLARGFSPRAYAKPALDPP